MDKSSIKLRVDIEKNKLGYAVKTWVFNREDGATLDFKLNKICNTWKEAQELKKQIRTDYFS